MEETNSKRNLLFGKLLSLAMRQLPSHLEKQHCTLALGRGPRHQAQSTLRRLPRAWPRSPSEPFLGGPGMSPCNILTLPPTTTSSCLPSLGVRATCRGPADFLQDPQPRGKGQHPSSTMSTTDWDPNAQTQARTQICFQLASSLFQGFPAASNHDPWRQKQGQPSNDSHSAPGQDPWP